MDELKNIILSHSEKYPEMEIADFVKLIYKNEFADSWISVKPEESLALIKREMMAANPAEGTKLLFPVGKGLFRLDLGAAKLQMLPAEKINEDFLQTASCVTGSEASFEEKLTVLAKLCEDGELPFSPDELSVFLSDCQKKGWPEPPHSAAYTAAYHPHYRIIRRGARVQGRS